MVRCCIRNTGFVVFELLKLISLGFNQASFHALLPSFFRGLLADGAPQSVLRRERSAVASARAAQPGSQPVHRDPDRPSSLTQFPGLILRVHDSPFQSRVPLGVVNFSRRSARLSCATSCSCVQSQNVAAAIGFVCIVCNSAISATNFARRESDAIGGPPVGSPIHKNDRRFWESRS
jgi:hypothetical protein